MPKRIELVPDNDRLFPVQSFFNSISTTDFIEVIQSLMNGIGWNINDADCTFPGDLDPGEKSFDGIRFSLYEDSVVINENTFKYFLIEACRVHACEHPEDQSKLEQILNERGWKLTSATN